jgi:hypothetical protein
MKSKIYIAAVGLAALGFASSADAFSFSPTKTRFTATGPVSATLNGATLNCTGKFRISTNKGGKGKVTAVTFSGSQNCKTAGAAGLPWAMTATGATTAKIVNADFTSPAGNCGPANLPVGVSGGVISFNGAVGQCSQVSFSLTTTPTISIVP